MAEAGARFAGRRVVVTGGCAGIGRAIALGFAGEGAEVAVCDADPDAVRAFSDAHPEISAAAADVTDAEAMADWLGGVEARWGGADVVCANAGTGGPAGRIEDLEPGDWARCVEVNLIGAFLTCRWAARVMRAQGRGALILTASTAGLWGYPLRSPYAAAKWGVIGLMKTLASELGPAGVRVNALCPGAVEGERMDRVIAATARARGEPEAAVRDSFVRGVAMRSFVTAGDIAEAAMFLASDAGRFVSGQALAIDGHTESLA